MRKNIPARIEITCDRCSATIAPLAYPQLQLQVYHAEKAWNGDVGGSRNIYDLCPICIQAFDRFMAKKE